ncbi:MAG: cupin domain-containing protein [bacterium]|nr:cupin domain-containing protein [bacterium]
MNPEDIIKLYDLKPHPEGGFYKETYRSTGVFNFSCHENSYTGPRNYSTAIYFLLTSSCKSKFHKLGSDEIWHFYLGGSVTIIQLFENGRVEKVVLGQDINNREKLQHVIPAGCWFGAYPDSETEFSFLGCTVAPGFDFKDFHLADYDLLLNKFPDHKDLISALTK